MAAGVALLGVGSGEGNAQPKRWRVAGEDSGCVISLVRAAEGQATLSKRWRVEWTGVASSSLWLRARPPAGRCGWLMHEGGHYSLTGQIALDRALQTVPPSPAAGISLTSPPPFLGLLLPFTACP